MIEQLSIPGLFGPAERKPAQSPEESCIDWLMRVHDCSESVIPYVKRLFENFPRAQAWDRAKVLTSLCGKHKRQGWSLADAEYIDLFSTSIVDYHVLWDRSWAIQMLVPRELVPKVWNCSFGGEPEFYDSEGNLLFKSIYSVNGKVLTDDERSTALADRDGGQQ